MMKKRFFGFIFHQILGWHGDIAFPLPEKCIICIAPHTSNWDFVIGELFIHAYGWKSGFMMKKNWFFWPLGPILKKMGGIPINRSKNTSTVDQIIEKAKESTFFHLGITPEATRKPNPNWKHGFYYIALGAHIPIVLIAIDYGTKSIVCKKKMEPTGEVEKEMQEIKQYFTQFKGKHPESFAI